MGDDHRLPAHVFTELGSDVVPCLDMLPVSVHWLEPAIWGLRKFDLLEVVHPVLGVRHVDFGFSAEEPKIGPKGPTDEPNTANFDCIVFQEMNVRIILRNFAGFRNV
jgi:hypothetical protein